MFGHKKTKEIVDIHTHMLPALDDGSQSMRETLKMLEIAYKEGITSIIMTPHFKHGHHNAGPETIQTALKKVKSLAVDARIPISIYAGNEVRYFGGIEEALEKEKFCTMNGTKYILVEFYPTDEYSYIRNAVGHILGMGYVPIVAHAERYIALIEHYENMKEIKRLGAKIQVNAESVIGKLGRKVTKVLMRAFEEGLIDYIGTDSHDSKRRKPQMKKCAQLLYRKFDEDYIDYVLFENASETLLNQL